MKTQRATFRPSLLTLAAAVLVVGAVPARAQYRFESLLPPQAPTGDNAEAEGINNLGEILIQTWSSSTGVDGYYVYNIYSKTYKVLPQDPDAVAGGVNTFYNELNDTGQFVGLEESTTHTIPTWASTLGYEPLEAFQYNSFTGVYDNFTPTTPGAFVSEGTGINDFGQMVGINNAGSGDQGWVRIDGVFTTIDVLPTGPMVETGIPSGPTTDPYDINNLGVVVGTFSNPASALEAEGFKYDIYTRTFTTVDFPGNTVTVIYGNNDKGDIVGYTTNDPTQTTADGFVGIDGKLTLVDYPDAAFTNPTGITDEGLIAGGYQDTAGLWHAYLAVPDCTVHNPGPSHHGHGGFSGHRK